MKNNIDLLIAEQAAAAGRLGLHPLAALGFRTLRLMRILNFRAWHPIMRGAVRKMRQPLHIQYWESQWP